ncbi:MAG: cyclic pyranopterin monophosphate synthase MoaC [Actinobacteria bacterium]|nr:cyclic pyranopterin monophosphate synthase MoaC [Actinomycetota bacterium]
MVEDLTHINADGDVHMVSVGSKQSTDRVAIAEAFVTMDDDLRTKVFAGDTRKGDVLATVRIAAIMAAKRTSELIPLCHPLTLSGISVDVEQIDTGARIEVRVETSGQTGVEMEAMTAASIAAVTMYDMVKSVSKGVTIGPIQLVHKSGGKSGEWNR